MEIQEDKKQETIVNSSGTSTPAGSGIPEVSKSASSGTSSIVFTSPFEDTSGLDVFAQIAACAHPLPVRRSSTSAPTVTVTPIITPTPIVTTTPVNIPAPTPISASNSSLQQSQSQLAQSIYQTQQALRLQQQKRDSIDSTISKFDPKIEEEFDDDEFFSDDNDEDMEFDSESEQCEMRSRYSDQKNNLFDTPIMEESESDLMMDVDQSMNLYQRRRSPSLSTDSNDLNNPQMYARRLSAPVNSSGDVNGGGFSTRRVIHNICERKRRENIRDGFEQLQNRLPNYLANNPKLSKMEILAGARSLINEIRGRISNLSAEISALSLVSEQIQNEN